MSATRRTALGLVALCGAAGALSGAAVAQSPREVNFGLPVATINSSYCMFPTAMKLGYFADEGLNVKINNIAGSTSVVQTVLSGRLDIGASTPEPIIKAISDGNSLVMVYNFIRRPTGSVAVPADSPVKTMQELRGKRLGAQSLASGNIMLTNGILRKLVIVVAKEVTYLSVGVGAQALQAVRCGHVDGLVLFDSQYAQMEGLGAKFRYLYGEGQERLFSTQFFVRREVAEKDGHLVRGFNRAVAKATLFAQENPEACVRMLWSVFPSSRVAGMSEQEQMANDLAVLRKRMELLTPDEERGWGKYNPDDIAAWNEFAVEGGIINAPVKDQASLYTNDHIAATNDFDRKPIIDQAKTWKP